jgi:hypothetical protein
MNAIVRNEGVYTYGPTLARAMSGDHARNLFHMVEQSRVKGSVQVAVTSTYVPGALNVEALIDGLAPEGAVVALAIAARRLAQLYGGAREPVAVLSEDHAEEVRATAERLVDLCRSSRLLTQGELLTRGFDLSREDAVQEVMAALAVPAVTSRRLEKV